VEEIVYVSGGESRILSLSSDDASYVGKEIADDFGERAEDECIVMRLVPKLLQKQNIRIIVLSLRPLEHPLEGTSHNQIEYSCMSVDWFIVASYRQKDFLRD